MIDDAETKLWGSELDEIHPLRKPRTKYLHSQSNSMRTDKGFYRLLAIKFPPLSSLASSLLVTKSRNTQERKVRTPMALLPSLSCFCGIISNYHSTSIGNISKWMDWVEWRIVCGLDGVNLCLEKYQYKVENIHGLRWHTCAYPDIGEKAENRLRALSQKEREGTNNFRFTQSGQQTKCLSDSARIDNEQHVVTDLRVSPIQTKIPLIWKALDFILMC